jgi:hypothetical protein
VRSSSSLLLVLGSLVLLLGSPVKIKKLLKIPTGEEFHFYTMVAQVYEVGITKTHWIDRYKTSLPVTKELPT